MFRCRHFETKLSNSVEKWGGQLGGLRKDAAATKGTKEAISLLVKKPLAPKSEPHGEDWRRSYQGDSFFPIGLDGDASSCVLLTTRGMSC